MLYEGVEVGLVTLQARHGAPPPLPALLVGSTLQLEALQSTGWSLCRSLHCLVLVTLAPCSD